MIPKNRTFTPANIAHTSIPPPAIVRRGTVPYIPTEQLKNHEHHEVIARIPTRFNI